MSSTHRPQWDATSGSVAGALHMALDPDQMRGQRVPQLLDATAECDTVSPGLADASEEWNAANPDALFRLPTELVRAILRLLPFRHRIAVSHVSRGWRATALADLFLWNFARFKVDLPEPLGEGSHKEPPRKADILRALLARSDPVPFALAWESQQRAPLPDEIVALMPQNMHRMQELAVELSARDFAPLFALPAPQLRKFRCTADSAACTLPARWQAPLLRTLELGVVYVPADAQPLPSVEVFQCYALHGPRRPLSQLFPALRTLCIELHCGTNR